LIGDSFAVACALSAFTSTQTMCAPSLDEPMGDLLADAASRADDNSDLASQFLLRRHPAQLRSSSSQYSMSKGFPVAAGAIYLSMASAPAASRRRSCKLGRDARFALVLAEGDHAQAGDEYDRWVRVAHGGEFACLHLV